jgi:hypothetical protein
MRTQYIKSAVAYKENDVYFTFSGGTPHADSSAVIPEVNYMSIGEQNGGYINGTIKKVVYYPVRLSNAELVSLTENN